MKYDYMVKTGGKWYLPGEEIPEADKTSAPETEPDKKEPKKKSS